MKTKIEKCRKGLWRWYVVNAAGKVAKVGFAASEDAAKNEAAECVATLSTT